MGFRVFTTSVCDLIAIGLGTFSVLRKQTLYLPGGEAESPDAPPPRPRRPRPHLPAAPLQPLRAFLTQVTLSFAGLFN